MEMEIFTLLGLLGGEVGIRPSVNQATPDLPVSINGFQIMRYTGTELSAGVL